MKRGASILAGALALCCALQLGLPALARGDEGQPQDAAYLSSGGEPLHGLLLKSAYNRDYPAAPDGSVAVLGGQAETVVNFAREQGLNTLFLELSPRADALYRSQLLPSSRYAVSEEGGFLLADPFSVLLDSAKLGDLRVCASLSLLYAGEVGDSYSPESPVTLHPQWFLERDGSLYFDPSNEEVRRFWQEAVAELAGSYSFGGLLLCGLEDLGPVEGLAELLEGCIQAAHGAQTQLPVGLSLSGQALNEPAWQDWLQKAASLADFLLPDMEQGVENEAYSDELSLWSAAAQEAQLPLYTLNHGDKLCYPLVGEPIFGDPGELQYQLYTNTVYGAKGYLLSSYSDLSGLRQQILSRLAHLPDQLSSAERKLLPTQEATLQLAVEEGLHETIYTSYFLSGRCDPTRPLLINGEELDEDFISKDGFWGVQLELRRGYNHISVRQPGEQAKRLLIHSSIRGGSNETTLEDILPESVYPLQDQILFEGQPLTLSCTAPYGGSVMAVFQGNTYQLQPPEGLSEEELGQAVTYSCTIPLESLDSSQVQNLGRVSYFLSTDSFTSKYRSQGQLYLVGSGSRLAVRVEDALGPVYQSLESDTLIANLPFGTCDYAYPTADPDYFRLYAGGYIPTRSISVVEGLVDIQRSIATVGIQAGDQGETLIFVGGAQLPYYASFNEHSNTLLLQLNNVSQIPTSLSYLSSQLFDSINVQYDEQRSSCSIRLHVAPGQELWGYQVSFSGDNLLLQCKTPPRLSGGQTPLSGLTVVLDPGHGGSDPGEATAAGAGYPLEKELNLAYAQCLRRQLESLGAQVFLTRGDDSDLDEENRILTSGYRDADLYLSIHMGGTSVQQDAWREEGVSVYYDNELSPQLGQLLFQRLTQGLGNEGNRLVGSVAQVQKVPLAKALRIVPGVVSNPEDYQRLLDPAQVMKTCSLLCSGIEEYLRPYQIEQE